MHINVYTLTIYNERHQYPDISVLIIKVALICLWHKVVQLNNKHLRTVQTFTYIQWNQEPSLYNSI